MDSRDLRSAIARSVADALTFVVPTECAGCGEPDTELCGRCRRDLVPHPASRRLPDGTQLSWALPFEGSVARALRAFKSDGRVLLAHAFAPAVRAAALAAGTQRVVPVPSSAAAMRRRGYRPVELLATRAGLRVDRRLRWRRAVADQRGLDRAARARNAAGSLRAAGVEGASVVVFDDIVTTGATLAEAARALREAGAVRVVAVALAATASRFERAPASTADSESTHPGWEGDSRPAGV